MKPRSQDFVRKPLNHKIHFAGRFGATYFITICCSDRGVNRLCHEITAKSLFDTARIYEQRRRWAIRLILLMPDHLHAVIRVDGDSSLSRTIADFKRASARFAGIEWQRNFFDHRLRQGESLAQKAEYIRNNPVRAGLVAVSEQWPFVLDVSKMADR